MMTPVFGKSKQLNVSFIYIHKRLIAIVIYQIQAMIQYYECPFCLHKVQNSKFDGHIASCSMQVHMPKIKINKNKQIQMKSLVPNHLMKKLEDSQRSPSRKLFDQESTQASRQKKQKYSNEKSNSNTCKTYRTYINAQLYLPYFSIDLFEKSIREEFQTILQTQLLPEFLTKEYTQLFRITWLNLTINEDSSYFEIGVQWADKQQQFSENKQCENKQNLLRNSQIRSEGKRPENEKLEKIKQSVKQYAEYLINSYDVISFNIDSGYQAGLDHLKSQYIFKLVDNQIHFLAKKQDILWKIVKFFQKLISFCNLIKKVEFSSQILQFQQDKQKQIQNLMKSIYAFIVNEDQITIKTKIIDKKCLVFISGVKQSIQTCKQYLISQLQDKSSLVVKNYRLSEQQYKIIKRQKILQQLKSQIFLKYEFKPFTICRSYNPSKSTCVELLSSPSIMAIPKEAVIVLPEDIMAQIDLLRETTQFLNEYIFYSAQKGKDVFDAFKDFVVNFVDDTAQLGLIMPAVKREPFVQNIFSFLQGRTQNIKVYILQRSQERLAIQAFQNSAIRQRKWYAMIKEEKKYYPKQVNQNINKSFSSFLKQQIYVTSQQLGIKKQTHDYNYEKGEITHKKNNKVQLVEDQGEVMLVFLQQGCFLIHFTKKHKDVKSITFAVFQINFYKNTQRNLITGTQSPIGFDMVKRDEKTQLGSQKNQYQLYLRYPDEQTLSEVWNKIQNTLKKSKIYKKIGVEGISQQKLKHIINWCKLNRIQVSKVSDGMLEIYSYNEDSIQDLEKLIQLNKKNIFSGPIEYPPYWNADQKDNFKIYQVNQSTEQFKSVQKNFKVGKIKKLQRIQNRILFEKYNSQRNFLAEQNGAKVRQKMMYHGTRANDPQLIYADKQESFNINYANMGSYGKGIYFAKDSAYSNNYCYMPKGAHGNKQMFYCLVLVGTPEQYNGKQQFDTSFRDSTKKIRYQSVKSSNNEEIIVVFKNRRAYPLYLITY